jgi:hypothetical protein
MKTMGLNGSEHQNHDNSIAYISGAIGAFYQFLMNIHLDIDFWSKLLEAAITAGVCGFVGVAGKEIFVLLRDSFREYFGKGKDKKNE